MLAPPTTPAENLLKSFPPHTIIRWKKSSMEKKLVIQKRTDIYCVNDEGPRRIYTNLLLIYSLVIIWSLSSRQCSKNLCKIRARITSDIIFLWLQYYFNYYVRSKLIIIKTVIPVMIWWFVEIYNSNYKYLI